jgi:hypothetical protein
VREGIFFPLGPSRATLIAMTPIMVNKAGPHLRRNVFVLPVLVLVLLLVLVLALALLALPVRVVVSMSIIIVSLNESVIIYISV